MRKDCKIRTLGNHNEVYNDGMESISAKQTKMRTTILHLMPALPWPQEDLARSSSNMLFHTARLTREYNDGCDWFPID